MNSIKKRIELFRIQMSRMGLDACFISGTDPHASEYLPERWQTRAFITGFTGSFGNVALTSAQAGLWTDTRYFLQAEEQLKGSGVTMYKLRVPDAVSIDDWLKKHLEEGAKVGADAQTMSVSAYRNLEKSLSKKGIELLAIPDIFDKIWDDRPSYPKEKIFDFDIAFAGLSRVEKQKQMADKLENAGADFQVITMLDELAWMFNLRGADVHYNPVFIGFGLVGKKQSFLFADKEKLSSDLIQRLDNDGVKVEDYLGFYHFLHQFREKTFILDPQTASFQVYQSLKGKNKIIEETSKVSLAKARKNEVELNGFREAMKKDGIALVRFIHWLKSNLGKQKISEFDIGIKLKEFRAEQSNFKGESFPPIVGYKSHGAIVHLSVGPDNALEVEPEGILLFDSGGQYLDGTTDITRTIALGKVTKKQKTDYTLVLKGMISLSLAEFPYGTKGCHLDILARKPLWENGMNYGHGTGHGVGHFLNVHEGPMSIRQEFNEHKMEPGMVLSNEPAFYREGEYGIRTENMIVCVEKEETEFGRFLGFETLTLCPIDTSLIDLQLLSEKERAWLNQYHEKVNQSLKPLLQKELHPFLDELTQKI